VKASQTDERKEEILKVLTEAAKKYSNEDTQMVKFENETILITGKNELYLSLNGHGMESVDILPQEKIAFVAYNIGSI
jgi:hypothetical protein